MQRGLKRVSVLTHATAAAALFATALVSAKAEAQPAPLSESYVIGAWTFRPSFELRLRGEYRRDPVDGGGALYAATAVLADGYKLGVPDTVALAAPVKNQWSLGERARLGLGVDRGPVTGVVVLQDARVFGSARAALAGPREPTTPVFQPFEAYLDVHSRTGRRVALRLGRQRLTWGSGRLVSENDWSPTARSLDAARFSVQLGDVDVELLGAILSSPAELPPSVGSSGSTGESSGAELYGVDGVWHVAPLFAVELTGLSRIVRDPTPRWLKAGDTYVIDGRIFGDSRGFRYDLEGAYELGRVQSFGANRDLSALALAARVSLETSLPGHLTFGAQGAYASGDSSSSDPAAPQHRFDPILPDAHDNLGPMGLYAWSNVLEAGGDLSMKPGEDVTLRAGYRFVGLAQAADRWSTAALVAVGAAPGNVSQVLGSEIDASLGWTPVEGLRFSAGYGAFLFGSGARAILNEAGRDTGPAQHWGFLQTTVRAP